MSEPMTDERVVYGAICCWWDTIDKVATNEVGLPCCPLCGGMLMEVGNLAEWWSNVDNYEGSEPDYKNLIRFMRGKCFPNMDVAGHAYSKQSRSG